VSALRRVGVATSYCDYVLHDGLAWFSGYVPENAPDAAVGPQVEDVLQQIEQSLAEIGGGKDRILQAVIWLADMADFAALNAVWDKWVAPGAAPARACVEAKLADPRYRLEIKIIVAV
jgi:enamine deaminase RidA (YjgF/YER057c/UK114 family)